MNTFKFEFYEDKAGEHRWRVTAKNGEIIGASSEGFHSKAEADRNADRLATVLRGLYGE